MESESLLVTLLPVWLILGGIAGFLLYWYILKTDREREKKEPHVKPDRQYFFWKFLAGSLLPTVVIISIQRLLEAYGHAPQSLLVYVPYILGFTALLYFFFFQRILWRAKLKGNNRFYGHILLVLGLLFPPGGFLSLYPYFTKHIEEYEIGHATSGIKSAFINIKQITPRYEGRLDNVYRNYIRSRTDEKYDLQYIALVPLTTGPTDSVYTTWIYVSMDESTYALDEEAESKRTEDGFLQKGRDYMSTYNFSQVVYYENDLDHRLDKAWKLLERSGQLQDESVVLNPSMTPLNENGMDGLIVWAIFYFPLLGGTCAFVYSDDEDE